MKHRPAKERFEEKFRVTPGCWVWTAALGNKGYGHFWNGSKPVPAHRMSWELYEGEIQAGLHVLHRCDNHLCVNPNHLFLGTNLDNVFDKVQKGRHPVGEKGAKAKLTSDQVLAIRRDNRSQRRIAEDYGVSHTVIGHIKNRVIWRHL